jgi:dTDP-4-amino-4,6-dideoxygalactose transaminase
MKTLFLDLNFENNAIKNDLDAAYARVMSSGFYILGPEVEAFESEFAQFCGTKHCIGVANGLDALHLILRAMDIGSGDEVIVPANTFIASWLAISYAGAIPVPVEPDEKTYNIDPTRIEAAITPKTKAIMAVHLYGQPADMDAINAI